MSPTLHPELPGESEWNTRYFNYFTEIEEHFQRARGTALFLLSPLDWALIESWKNGGVPLDAVLHGIDNAFEKWRARKHKARLVNSLAYCAQEVMQAAQRTPSRSDRVAPAPPPFTEGDLRNHLQAAAAQLRQIPEDGFDDVAASLEAFAARAAEYLSNLEDLERHLTALEDKMLALSRALQTEAEIYGVRESLDRELRPYRSKMTAAQLSMLERRYLDSATLERAKLPRLSLFYLRPL